MPVSHFSMKKKGKKRRGGKRENAISFPLSSPRRKRKRGRSQEAEMAVQYASVHVLSKKLSIPHL